MWLTYDTKLSFKHLLHDEQWVKDKACLEVHQHTDSPLHVEMETIPDRTLDFKDLKEAVEFILIKYRDVNISSKFHLHTCEEFTRTLHGDITLKLRQKLHVPHVVVKVHLQETSKYGVTID